jgi:hypothetical protein
MRTSRPPLLALLRSRFDYSPMLAVVDLAPHSTLPTSSMFVNRLLSRFLLKSLSSVCFPRRDRKQVDLAPLAKTRATFSKIVRRFQYFAMSSSVFFRFFGHRSGLHCVDTGTIQHF